jgi:hypothetical protein
MERADNIIMSGPYQSLFVKGSVVIAVLLALAAPAMAMRPAPMPAVRCTLSILQGTLSCFRKSQTASMTVIIYVQSSVAIDGV